MAQLPSLPVYLAGCNTLLVLLGPTYLSRLWCVVELFTFYQAHLPTPPESKITLITLNTPWGGRPTSSQVGVTHGEATPGAPTGGENALQQARLAALGAARDFDVRCAIAALACDEERLLAVIEGCGDGGDDFSKWIRSLVGAKLKEDEGGLGVTLHRGAAAHSGEGACPQRVSRARSRLSRSFSVPAALPGSSKRAPALSPLAKLSGALRPLAAKMAPWARER